MIQAPTLVNRRARAVAQRARGEAPRQKVDRPVAVFRCGFFDLTTKKGRAGLLKVFGDDHLARIHLERNSEEIRFTDKGSVNYYIEWRPDAPPPTPIPEGFEFVVPRTQRRFGISVLDLAKADELQEANVIASNASLALFYRGKRMLDDGRCPCLMLWYEDEPVDDGTIPPPGQR